MGNSTHTFRQDERNDNIQISINGELVHRSKAVVSVFDSGFILGDGIWEGLRLHEGGLPFLDRHMKRLWEGAKALDLDMGLTQAELIARLKETLRANAMEDHVHIRLMVTRGIKATPYQDPAVTIGGPTIVIIPEYKTPTPPSMIAACVCIPFMCDGDMQMCKTLVSTVTPSSIVFLGAFRLPKRVPMKH